tara:strand:+ start:1193 stop:1351 length:159 start_codon:yes stop_codon:yes gene_type:complete
MKEGNTLWPVHFADDIPRWRVVSIKDGVIVKERTFHDEEEANEYLNTIDTIR